MSIGDSTTTEATATVWFVVIIDLTHYPRSEFTDYPRSEFICTVS